MVGKGQVGPREPASSPAFAFFGLSSSPLQALSSEPSLSNPYQWVQGQSWEFSWPRAEAPSTRPRAPGTSLEECQKQACWT